MKLYINKTRAEPYFHVEEANPTKQGLKHTSIPDGVSIFAVEEANPTKQGLKHCIGCNVDCEFTHVEEANPTKQGLKPGMAGGIHFFFMSSKRLIQQNKD